MESTDNKPEPTQQEEGAPETQSKNSQKKAARDAEKQKRLEERQKKANQQKEEENKIDPNDPCFGKFGDKELNRSQSNPDERYKERYVPIKNIDESFATKEVLIRGRLHGSSGSGKTAFLVVREQFSTI